MVVRDEDHMIRVNGPKRGKAIADDGEERNKDNVDYIDDVELLPADIDPAYVCDRLVHVDWKGLN